MHNKKQNDIYFVALTTKSKAGITIGTYDYLRDDTTYIDTLCILDESGKPVTPETAFSGDSVLVAWSGEFVYAALKCGGYQTDLSRWISLDAWRAASGLDSLMPRSPEDRAILRSTSGIDVEKQEEVRENIKAMRSKLCRTEAQVVRSTYRLMAKNNKTTEPDWGEWQAHVIINSRGVRVDTAFVHNYAILISSLVNDSETVFQSIFGTRKPQTVDVIRRVNGYGVMTIKSLNRSEIKRLNEVKLKPPKYESSKRQLFDKLQEFQDLRTALMYRDIANDNKLNRLEWQLYKSGGARLRGAYKFNGTITGRWVSTDINLHNLTKDATLEELTDIRGRVMSRDIDALIESSKDKGRLWLLRTAFIPSEGCRLVMMDYKAIEARLLAFMVGEEWKMEAFKKGLDVYRLTAAKVFGLSEREVTDEHRKIGKTADLAMGYGGGVSVLANLLGNQTIAKRVVNGWRDHNQKTTAFWERIKKAFDYTYKSGKPSEVNGVILAYVNERVEVTTLTGRTIVMLDKTSELSGAKITARVIQSMARDILAKALVTLTDRGFSVVMHTQDEVVVELPTDDNYTNRAMEMQDVMTECGGVIRGLAIPFEVSVKDGEFYY